MSEVQQGEQDTPQVPEQPETDTPPTPDEQPPETDPTPAPTPDEPHADTPEGFSEKEMEKRFQSLEKEATRHANRISEIMGEEAQQLEVCPLCNGPFSGFIFPRDVAPIPEATAARVRTALGLDPDENYRVAEDAETCDKCDGLGKVLTGSKVIDQITKPCSKCIGYGWTKHGAPQTNGAGHVLQVVGDERLPLDDARPVDADPWGRGPGDPDYGRLPQYVRS